LLDVSIIHLRKQPLFQSVIPSKLFECMGMGIPVLHGVPGESARIVQTEQVGEVFESDHALQLVEGLIKMKENQGYREALKANCLVAAPKYDRKNLADKMLAILKGL
jgi:hypothetical protein